MLFEKLNFRSNINNTEIYCLIYGNKIKDLTLPIISKTTLMTWKAHEIV